MSHTENCGARGYLLYHSFTTGYDIPTYHIQRTVVVEDNLLYHSLTIGYNSPTYHIHRTVVLEDN